jgi:hypothetical protein
MKDFESNSDCYDDYDDQEHQYNPSPMQEDEGLDMVIDFLNTEKVDLKRNS